MVQFSLEKKKIVQPKTEIRYIRSLCNSFGPCNFQHIHKPAEHLTNRITLPRFFIKGLLVDFFFAFLLIGG